ncbi:hypothetical protein Ae706Ps2_1384c [Pseudonocardia sp. Ae706_Ps2]|nr:hypothetical protein Ae706Ps2_1384c [Pseudonocardia sp. Ae706_Ps2]
MAALRHGGTAHAPGRAPRSATCRHRSAPTVAAHACDRVRGAAILRAGHPRTGHDLHTAHGGTERTASGGVLIIVKHR